LEANIKNQKSKIKNQKHKPKTQKLRANSSPLRGEDRGGGDPQPRKLTHVDKRGRARMVDVSGKEVTPREAIAKARVEMSPETLRLIQEGGIPKGDVLAVAQVAGIMAAKRTHELIPMCHPLSLTGIDVKFHINEGDSIIEIEAAVRTNDRTGVEMEALTAASIAALTIYDMCKAVERGIKITDIRLIKKSGGKSGTYEAR
jgi:cyclic pyranopterin phosphate synthase